MVQTNLTFDEKTVLLNIGKIRRYITTEQIARLSQLHISITKGIVNKFEKLQLVKSYPIRKLKHPIALTKEYFMRGRTPSDIYEVKTKEYLITQKGLILFYLLEKELEQ
jgi:hypothetical protein